MFAQLYQNSILRNPKTIFALLVIAILSFGYYSKDFRLDASSETLLIEGDPDLAYLQEVTERYGSKDFLKSKNNIYFTSHCHLKFWILLKRF